MIRVEPPCVYVRAKSALTSFLWIFVRSRTNKKIPIILKCGIAMLTTGHVHRHQSRATYLYGYRESTRSSNTCTGWYRYFFRPQSQTDPPPPILVHTHISPLAPLADLSLSTFSSFLRTNGMAGSKIQTSTNARAEESI